MEINYIKEFVILAETQNFLEAAETLFISQSSLSKHIKSLESEIGFSLFERTTRRVKLNEYGKTFLIYAKQIVHLQHQYTTALINQSSNMLQSLNIASIPVMAPYGITDVIMRFEKENKNVRVNLIESESSHLKELLRQDKCELAFIREKDNSDDEFAKIPYTSDSLVAILPISHPLANEKELSLEQLKDDNFLLLQSGYILYDICFDACTKAGFHPRIIYTGQNAANIIDLVGKGMGVSLLMKKPIALPHNRKISIIDIKPQITTQINLYYKKEASLSIAAKHFIDTIQMAER